MPKLNIQTTTDDSEKISIIDTVFNGIDFDFDTNGKLTTLSIELNLEQIPSSITQCTNLEVLNLTGNRFSKLPGFIASLSNLKLLTVENYHTENLPDQIKKLVELDTLAIISND